LGDLRTPIDTLNQLRNQAAHDLDFKLNDAHQKRLIDALPSRLAADDVVRRRSAITKPRLFALRLFDALAQQTTHAESMRALKDAVELNKSP
jgi:hypothetical protein